MKIAFPSNDGQINQHFGQSREFAILEIEDQKIINQKIIPAESFQHNHEGLADLLDKEDVRVVVSGNIGQHALEALDRKGFKVIRGISGDIRSVTEQFIRGTLVSKSGSCGQEHGHCQDHGHSCCH